MLPFGNAEAFTRMITPIRPHPYEMLKTFRSLPLLGIASDVLIGNGVTIFIYVPETTFYNIKINIIKLN